MTHILRHRFNQSRTVDERNIILNILLYFRSEPDRYQGLTFYKYQLLIPAKAQPLRALPDIQLQYQCTRTVKLSRYVSSLTCIHKSHLNGRSSTVTWASWHTSITVTSTGLSAAVTCAILIGFPVSVHPAIAPPLRGLPEILQQLYQKCLFVNSPVPVRSDVDSVIFSVQFQPDPTWTTDNIARHFLRYSSTPTTSAQDCCSQVFLIIVQILKCLWSLCAFHCMKMLCVAGNFNTIISI